MALYLDDKYRIVSNGKNIILQKRHVNSDKLTESWLKVSYNPDHKAAMHDYVRRSGLEAPQELKRLVNLMERIHSRIDSLHMP